MTAVLLSLALSAAGVGLVIPVLPLFCIGGIGAPALQAMISAGFGDDEQGRLQGTLASLTSLASVIGPFSISLIYFATRDTLPGLIWLLGAGLSLLCIPALRMRQSPDRAPRR
jgi:DHA1 family tetracycline resistance protein-like MFS transporter